MAKAKEIFVPLAKQADGLPASVCRACGSSKRAPYVQASRHEFEGREMFWMRTRCLDCGQIRMDRIECPAGSSGPLTFVAAQE